MLKMEILQGHEDICRLPHLRDQDLRLYMFFYTCAFLVLMRAKAQAYLKSSSDHLIGIAQWVYGHSIPAFLLMFSVYLAN